MEETLKTKVLDGEKSRFRVELIKSENGKLFVTISQSTFLQLTEKKQSRIRVRANDLEAVIQTLVTYQSEIKKNYPRKKALNNTKREEIINRYLNKCLEIETLAVQFDCSVTEIRQIFFENNIVVTSNSIAKDKPVKRFLRRKRKRSG